MFSDPEHQDEHVWQTTRGSGATGWDIGDAATGAAAISVDLPRAVDGNPDSNLTYGEFVAALVGLNQVRLDYPMLLIDAELYRAGSGQDSGLLWIQTFEPEPGSLS